MIVLQPILHSLNIGTLAAWLSVAGFGAVGVMVPGFGHGPVATNAVVLESVWVDPEVDLGDAGEPGPAGEPAAESVENLPAPPALPDLAELPPLPEIPDLPAPAPKVTAPAKATAEPAPRREKATTNVPRATGARATGSTAPSGSRSGGSSANGGAGGGGSGMSDASRLASGRMPAPSYPSESRRKGQTGTVVVEFTVDSAGKVISAYAKSPSPWPLLNDEAVRTVRRWKFPPGGVMKLQRPIVFRLN